MIVMERGALFATARTRGGGDRVARFEALFAAHADGVYSYARRRTTREDAEDVVSEAFLTAWRRLDELPSEPFPWLIGVARNVLANRRRADHRRAALHDRLRRSARVGVVRDPGETTTDQQNVVTALASLSAGEREVIELIAWEGLSPSEVAIALGIARATVYVRLHRIRRQLAHAFEEGR